MLDQISSLMGGSALASSSSDPSNGRLVEGHVGPNHNLDEGIQNVGWNKDTYGLEGARICATLSQITVVLDQKGPG